MERLAGEPVADVDGAADATRRETLPGAKPGERPMERGEERRGGGIRRGRSLREQRERRRRCAKDAGHPDEIARAGGVAPEEARGGSPADESDVDDERTGGADRVAADDPRPRPPRQGLQPAGDVEDERPPGGIDGDRNQRVARPGTHGGEVREADGERLPAKVLGTGPVQPEVDALDEHVGRRHLHSLLPRHSCGLYFHIFTG